MQQVNRYLIENLGTKEINVLTPQDRELVGSFNLNSVSFDPNKHTVDLKVYDFNETYLETFYNVGDYTVEGTTVLGGPVQITVDPVTMLESRGYLGDVIAEFEAFNNLFSPRKSADSDAVLFLSEISSDRTEIRAQSTTISDTALKSYVNQLADRFNDRPYFSEVYLRFLDAGFDAPCINVLTEVVDGTFYVTFKLYKPLPTGIEGKDRFSVVERIGEPSRFKVTREVDIVEDPVPHIKGPNFEIDLEQQKSLTSKYYNLQELFSYPVSSSRYDLYSIYNQNSAEIGLDFTKFSDFVHFSSAEERLENFRYKLGLITEYEKTIADLSDRNYVDPNIETYRKLEEGILANFDPYERFLYFTNDPKAWPKSNDTRPYINVDPAETEIEGTPAYEWWTEIIAEAQDYDEHNADALINSVPEDIRNNSANDAYVAFVHMIGQHFDEQWTYAKALADRYNADNRLDFGISKDLVKEALRGFGFTLQESTQNLTDLFDLCKINGEYDPGTEVIHTFKRISTGLLTRTLSSGSENTASSLTVIDVDYATSSGSISGSIYGPVKVDISAQVSGSFDGVISGSFSGYYNGDVYDGALVGDVSGTLDGYLSEAEVTGEVDASAAGTVSGSFFNGAVISGGPLNLKAATSPDTIQPVSLENYRKEVYKRIYHNIPHLLKTKGTTRGLRALINCFGIPEDILEISVTGNVKLGTSEGPTTGTTSSRDRIRIASVDSAPVYVESAGFESSSVLSNYAKVKSLVQSYSDSSHEVHVGFNLNKETNKVFQAYLEARNVKYDDLIGDPGNQGENYEKSLGNILKLAIEENRDTLKSLRSPAGIIRLVRYMDSTLFRAVQEFIPARAELQTGVIVEDNILHRNRYRGVEPSGEEKHYEGEIKTGFITGSNNQSMEYTQQPSWKVSPDSDYEANEPQFDGELSGSDYVVTDGEVIKRNFWVDAEHPLGYLMDGNPFLHANEGRMRYNVNMKFLSLPKEPVCNMSLTSTLLGKSFRVYTPEFSRIRYRVDDGDWYDGMTLDETLGFPLDGGSAQTRGMVVDAGTTAVTGSAPKINTNFQGGDILIDFIHSWGEILEGKYVNQVELEPYTSGSSNQNYIFTGWYVGQITDETSPLDIIDAFIYGKQRMVIDQESLEDAYTARFVGVPTGFNVAPVVSVNVIGAYYTEITNSTQVVFEGAAFPLGVVPDKATFQVKVGDYCYEGEYPVGGGLFIVDIPGDKSEYYFEDYGFSEIVWSGKTFKSDSGLEYISVPAAGGGLKLNSIPWRYE